MKKTKKKVDQRAKQICCEECGKGLGYFLFGKGGVEDRAQISISKKTAVCNECISKK